MGSKQERKCHDVSELLCSLKESVQHEEIPAVFTVQKCHTVTERVCDTAYGTEITERDDFKCIRVPNTYCALKERTVYDKTCRTMINFDCKPQDYGSFSKILVPMDTVALGPMVMETLDMIVLTVVMAVLVLHLNTNASEHRKPSAILLHAQFH